MDVFDTIITECDDKVTQLKDFLAGGSAKTYEEYRAICGEIKGLLNARNYTIALRRNFEESDD